MLQEIKIVIKEEGKVLQTLTKETSTQPCHLVKSLEEFQQSSNAALTKLIEKCGDTVEVMEDDEESDDDDEDCDVPATPKKKRK